LDKRLASFGQLHHVKTSRYGLRSALESVNVYDAWLEDLMFLKLSRVSYSSYLIPLQNVI